jgi:acetolactate synthase small subunit
VTWFAPSLFTPAGVDIYSSRKEGVSEGLYKEIEAALQVLEANEVAELCKSEMMAVKIEY